MRNNLVKRILHGIMPDGSVHRVIAGPMRGIFFRKSAISGLSPLFSGAERLHQKALRQYLHEGAVFIDIGASWGLHTLFASVLVGTYGRVFSFEPFALAYEDLTWNIGKNSFDNARAFLYALSDSDGKTELLHGKNAIMGFMKSESLKAHEAEFLSDTVFTKKLDTFMEDFGLKRMDVIKIDVEGAEDRVLMGAEKSIIRFRPVCLIDLHTPRNDVFVAQWFISRGYRIVRLDKSKPEIKRFDIGWPHENGVWGSIIALPGRKNQKLLF